MLEVLTIKKLKKDGSIDNQIVQTISSFLENDKIIVFPIDGVYGVMSAYSKKNIKNIEKIFDQNSIPDKWTLISGYNWIDEVAMINKRQYDFLHRIWPDEINVVLQGNTEKKYEKQIMLRMPRIPFINDILNKISVPCVFYPILSIRGKYVFRKKELINLFEEKIELVVYLNEWNRLHVKPTLIDIREEQLEIIESGKVSSEEIQSLFFLDTSEEAY